MMQNTLREEQLAYRKSAKSTRKDAIIGRLSIKRYENVYVTRSGQEAQASDKIVITKKATAKWSDMRSWPSLRSTERMQDRSSNIEELCEIVDELKQWSDNWDDSGAKAPNHQCLEEIVRFFTVIQHEAHGISSTISVPEVNPYIDGSIDVVWRGRTVHLIINFSPAHVAKPAFYTDRFDYSVGISGRIDLNSPQSWEHVILALETLHRDGLAG